MISSASVLRTFRPAMYVAGLILAFLTITQAAASEDYYPLTYSLNDFGGIGLLETRTARFAPDGEFAVGVSLVNPHRRYSLNWQILPFVEATFRYVDFTNTTFGEDGGVEVRSSLSDRDFFKSLVEGIPGSTILGRQFDVKFLLREESDFLPQIAVGLQDFVGTGESSGEYIVGSKRFYDLDFSLGVGWGYFAGRKAFKNPMRLISSSFSRRNANTELGGTFNYRNFFSGEHVGIFGGIEYATPVRGLTLKAEYNSATNLTPLGADPEFSDFPVGFAVNYRPYKSFEASIGLERGDTLMVRAALRTDLHTDGGLPKFDPMLPPLHVRPETQGLGIEEGGQMLDADIADVIDRIFDSLEVNGIAVEAVSVDPDRLRIQVGRLSAQQVTIARRSAIEAAQIFPDDIKEITFEQIGVAQNLTWFVDELLAQATRDAIVLTFSRTGLAVTRVDLNERDVRVEVAGHWGRLDRLAQKTVAVAAFERLPDRVAEIRVFDATGTGRSFDRRALERARSTDLLFDLVADRGLEIIDMQLTEGVARISVAAPAWVGREDYREVASRVGAALGGSIQVMLVGFRGDDQVVQFTERALDEGSVSAAGPELRQPKSVPIRQIEHRSQDEIAAAVFADLDSNGFRAQSLLIESHEVILYVDEVPYLQEARNAGWIVHLMSAHLPREVEKITIARMGRGIEVSRMSFFRSDVERMAIGPGSAEEVWARTEHGTTMGRSMAAGVTENRDAFPAYEWSLGPVIRQHFGAPEGILFVDVMAALSGSVRPTPGLTFRGQVSQFLFGNIDKLELRDDSELKPVRSLLLNYQQEGKTAIEQLEADYVIALAPNLAGRVGVGLFEQMYGGIGGEVYYHRPNSPWAIGANIYWVKQREFSGGFGFNDLTSTTGHVSFYYDLPLYDLRAKVHAGRYLAGDWGATFDLSREFRSGVTVGAFATITDVPAEEFGEGRFDRGFYMRFPLELFTLRSGTSFETFLFRPVSRDGGQMLLDPARLPEIVRKGEAMDYLKSWRKFGS